MDKIHTLLGSVFNHDGWLIQNGYRVNEDQKLFAFKTLESLITIGNFNFLEAGTGVGKSFAYLLPLVAYATVMKRRVIIATHSIALQKVLLSETLKMVSQCLVDHDVSIPIIEQRIGMQHFVDPRRVAARLESDDITNSTLALEFMRWAKYAATSGSGLINEWETEHGELPFNLTTLDICLVPHSVENSNNAFDAHKLSAKLADVVITSHMMLMASLNNSVMGEFQEGDVVLFDEADSVQNAAESLINRHVRLSRIQTVLEKCEPTLTTKSKVLANSIINTVNVISADIGGGEVGYKGFSSPKQLSSHLDGLYNLLNQIKLLKVKKSHQEGGSAFDIGDLVYDAEQVLENLGRYSNLMCFHTSPIKHQRSYIVSSNKPTLILKAITNKGAIVLCTSATLKDRAYKKGAEDTFQHFASSLGVNEKEINVTVSIEPRNFGKTQYVLADKSAPVPFIKNGNDADLNHSWIKYVISTIRCATSSGDKLLVLASSYKEVRALESAWGSSKGATFHTEGGVTESFNRFMKSKDKCLVTPAGWSGFNFRTDTKQVFAGVMVTKVPFSPPSEIAVIRKAYELTGDVVLNTQNIPLARKYVYRSSLEATIAKLIQGFGRLIRNPNDVGTIWVADPRFPHAQDTKHTDLRNAVPDRFKSQFETHQVISVNGQLNENTQPKIDEMVGFI